MKRWDLVAFAALALIPLGGLTLMVGIRATRIPPLVASLPGRVEERLGPIARPSHWPGTGVFGGEVFEDLRALAMHKASPAATSALKEALARGARPPGEYVALEREQRERVERILRASRAPRVDPPVAWRFASVSSSDYVVGPFAWLVTTRAVLAATPGEAVEACVDAAGVARDIGYRSGLIGMRTRGLILAALEAPCHRILSSAPAALRARAVSALEMIAQELPPFASVLEEEALDYELLMAEALPDRWLARIPREVRAMIDEIRRKGRMTLWMRSVSIDAWPDVHAVILGMASDLRAPDDTVREAAYKRGIKAAERSLNWLALMAVTDYSKHAKNDLESRTSLASLIAADR